MKKLLLILLFPIEIFAQKFTQTEINRFQQQAKKVEIIRDTWGIPHIYGKSDADAVFGLLYAQCEDDFKRVEMNYIEKLGRLSEIKGEKELYNDLQIRLLIDSVDAIADYKKAEPYLKKLLNAYADGINFYLHKHPDVKPALLTRFQPWYPLLWTDGSIGAISTADISNDEIQKFYSGNQMEGISKSKTVNASAAFGDYQQTGSNGFAIAPSKTASGNAILYINPHVTFYFRPEVQVVSEEGLNAYGAVTWGQMFIYQGFNEHAGWMHTSSYADVADVYAETVKQEKGKWFYLYENKWLPIKERTITIDFKKLEGPNDQNFPTHSTFTTYKTHHGPIMGSKDGKWLSLRENNRSLNALLECWTRTKAKNLSEYKTALNLLANNSNNTVYADGDGNIAYWHGNFMPKRSKDFDFTRPVDGTHKATEWQGVHALNEIVQSINPANGWLQNCNATPFSVAGNNSPNEKNYPAYMAPDGQNARGINAVRLLEQIDKISLDDLIQIGYNKHLTAFDILLPPFIEYTKTVSLSTDQKKAIQYLTKK